MLKYAGFKLVNCKPMTRLQYNQFRGWELPSDENGSDDGYLVEYIDGGKANTSEFMGYVSWSPKDVFDKSYKRIDSLTFGMAVEALKAGKKVARAGWNGKGMFLVLVPGQEQVQLREGTPYSIALPDHKNVEILPHIDMWTINAHGRRAMLPGWVASQTDILSDDWIVID